MNLDTYLAQNPSARLVTWPFRALGAVLVLSCAGAVATSIYLTFADHQTQAALFTLALLPMSALVVRTVGLVALSGKVPIRPLWPFPSGVVAFVWIVVSTAILQLYAVHA